jgi:hypothetical protein
MAFVDQFKLAYKVMFKPNKTTFTDRPIGDMLKFYYKILAIPLIAFIALELVLYLYGVSQIGTPIILGIVIASILAYMLIGNLVAFFVWAVIIHLFGMGLRQFKKSFDNTLTGVIYGAVPATLFIWVLAIPTWGEYLFALFAFWGLIITIMAIANQQRITKMASLGVFLAILIVAVLLLIVFGYLVLSYFSGIGSGIVNLVGGSLLSPAAPKCIALNQSYSCSNVTISSSGMLSADIVQNAPYNVSNVWVGCLLNLQSRGAIKTNPIVNQSSISGYNSGNVLSGNFQYGEETRISGLQCYNIYNGTAINYLQPGERVTGLLTIHYTQQTSNVVRLVYAIVEGPVYG